MAALVQGLSGFAFGLVAMAIWAWTLPPQLAGPLVVFGSIVGQLLALGSLRRIAGRGRAWPFVFGGCVGTPIGVWMLRYIDPTVFKLAVGLILIAYCPAMLLFRAMPRVTVGGRLADASVGMVGGIMGGLGGLNGPAPTLWCGLRGWSVHEQRMVFQTFSLSMQMLTLAMYAATGLITREAVWLVCHRCAGHGDPNLDWCPALRAVQRDRLPSAYSGSADVIGGRAAVRISSASSS